ncbi:MAG: Nif11-like leader peptide family RiPP precursor [Clostridia bacterium]|nr:Nif11-like leader peptide family RiPP precursor [Clostridia bacterium]
MSLENAKKFVQMVQEDEALKARVANLKPEEALAAAKELGLEFTANDLEEAIGDRVLDMDELVQAAGGIPVKTKPCPNDPNGKHDWVKTGHREIPHKFLWIDFTDGYDYFKCSKCGAEKRKHT